MLKQVKGNFGPVHGLINSAYPRNKAYGAKYENIKLSDWRENVDMHLNGYFNVTQKVSKVMMEQNFGNIVNIASIYGVLGPDFGIYEGTNMTMPGEYSVIKGGLVNFTRYLATYLAKYNIRVNCVSPGGIFDSQPQSFVEKYMSRTPMGRMGNPEEIVGGIIYLLSDLSSFVTGHNLMVDGGWSSW
jgi:NAD(P)-dependent dehydrogenase (short-subunit alcohol dehydrogenase family)